MPAHMVQRDAGRDLAHAVDERDPPVVDRADDVDHVFDVERVTHHLFAHVLARGIAHLALLEVERGVREHAEVAAMIVVHVRQHHMLRLRGIDTDDLQRLRRCPQVLALALRSLLGVEAGIDHIVRVLPDNGPDVIIHRARHVVCIREDEMLGLHRVALGVLDGVNLIGFERAGHASLPSRT